MAASLAVVSHPRREEALHRMVKSMSLHATVGIYGSEQLQGTISCGGEESRVDQARRIIGVDFRTCCIAELLRNTEPWELERVLCTAMVIARSWLKWAALALLNREGGGAIGRRKFSGESF
jgi:hypothetical protein